MDWGQAADKHKKLVASVVANLGIRGEAAADSRQEGLIALRKAAERYKPERNAAFSTFCRRVLIRAIVKKRKGQHMVRVPNSTMDKVDAFRKRPGEAPRTSPETEEAVDRTLRMRRVGLDDMAGRPGGCEDELERADEAEALRRAVLRIPPRPRQVLIRVHGLFGNDAESVPDVARDLEITAETARELLALAVEELTLILVPREDD